MKLRRWSIAIGTAFAAATAAQVAIAAPAPAATSGRLEVYGYAGQVNVWGAGDANLVAMHGRLILSNLPIKITSTWTDDCVNLGATPYGYAADCSRAPFVSTVTVDLGAGNDDATIVQDSAIVRVYGRNGGDTLRGASRARVELLGNDGNDALTLLPAPPGTKANHVARGGEGRDVIGAGNGYADQIYCGDGDGVTDLVGRGAGDTLHGCRNDLVVDV